MRANGPEGCPECGSVSTELLVVRRDRLVRRCECGHRWCEEREQPLMQVSGYVTIGGAR